MPPEDNNTGGCSRPRVWHKVIGSRMLSLTGRLGHRLRIADYNLGDTLLLLLLLLLLLMMLLMLLLLLLLLQMSIYVCKRWKFITYIILVFC